MGSKGSRLAFLAVVIIVAIAGGIFFYEKPVQTPDSSSSTSSVVEEIDSSSSSEDKTTSSVTGSTKSSSKTSGGAKTQPKQQPYPAGITPVQQVTADMKGSKVTVRGYAVKMTSGKGHHFYTFRDIVEPGSIKAVVFKAESENQAVDAPLQTSLNTGSPVTLTGKVDVYKGELEIIVNRTSE